MNINNKIGSEYRMLETEINVCTTILDIVDSKTKRIRATLLSHTTTTGRLACQANGAKHTCPIERGKFNKAFKPEHENFIDFY